MQILNTKKDGAGNIIISEDSFEFLLSCLDNQKYNPAKTEQSIIDDYNTDCRNILHQKYIFEAIDDGYFLTKRYLYQDKITPWSSNDVSKVYELFKDTKIIRKDVEEPAIKNDWMIADVDERWLIERPMRYDHDYLTISEDGINNRPWTDDEIERISIEFDGYKVVENKYQIEKMWTEQLSKMDINIIENFIRKNKIKKLS